MKSDVQDPFSVASRLDAASKPSHVSHSAYSKPPIMAQQLRHTHILSLKVRASISLPSLWRARYFCLDRHAIVRLSFHFTT